jgi:ABC-type amino acid transport substrate-binding protein
MKALSLFTLPLLFCLFSCAEKYEAVSDLATKRLCVLSGSIFDQAFSVYFPSGTEVVVPTMPELPQAILDGKCDGGFVGESQGRGILEQNPQIGVVRGNIQEWASSIAFAFAQADTTGLLKRFNIFLSGLEKAGTLDSIVSGWRTNAQAMPTPEFPATTAGKRTLRVGTAAEEPPVTFRRGDQFAGIDMDIMARFAQADSFAVQIEVIPFDQLLTALHEGKIDIAANQVSITPERMKLANFSDPYMYEPVVVLAAKKNLK